MIEHRRGDILTADVEALVNSVNCVGVMGRGVALEFKNAFPDNYRAYRDACKRNELRPGRMFVFETWNAGNPRYIINFPTKRHWRQKSRLEDISTGLDALAKEIAERSIQSVAFPPLGSGLGGLDWRDVRPRIEGMLASLNGVRAVIFEPGSEPEKRQQAHARTRVGPTLSEATIIGLVNQYHGPQHPAITLLELHKLLYFMQADDEPLQLGFEAGHYGPYATKLGHVLSRMEGNFITGYHDGKDEPRRLIDLVPGAARQAHRYLEEHPMTRKRLQRVAELVKGFESPSRLELLATTHWIASGYLCADESTIIDEVHSWNRRKRGFSEQAIRQALYALRQGGRFPGLLDAGPKEPASTELTADAQGTIPTVADEEPLVSVKLPEGSTITAVELAKLVIACDQLEEGQEITSEVIAGLDAKHGDIEKKAKRVRSLARGSVGYRDVTKDRGKPHRYDADTANDICKAGKFPLRFQSTPRRGYYDDNPPLVLERRSDGDVDESGWPNS